jgi:hypothetical protein
MVPINLRPKWWQLYLTFPLLIALFALDQRLKLSPRGHTVLQIGILLFVYGLIYLWLKANASALSSIDHGRIAIMRVFVSQAPDADAITDRAPMFELPAMDGKGMLSDTFELDCIDAEVVEQECSDGRVGGALPQGPYRDHK